MKRLIISSAVLVLGFAGTGVSLADPPSNGSNPGDYGLCKAYYNGDGNGKGQGIEHKRSANAFVGLVERAGDYDEDGDRDADDVTAYCGDTTPGGK